MADITTVMNRPASLDLSDPSVDHDRVFIVGGQKFYVLSQVLSLWSEHFRRMFEGNFAEAKQKEIEIKEVEPELFKKYLLILYKNTWGLKVDDLILLIHLSYRFLTPHVLDFCKKFIDENLDKLGPLKLELLKNACLYENEDIKKKLVSHFMNDNVMKEFTCGEVTDIVIEYNLEDLKAWLGGYMSKNLTFANCIDLLESSVKFNMPTLKEGISKQIATWPDYDPYSGYYETSLIPRNLIIDLAKAAFKHNVESLKKKLRFRIRYVCSNQVPDSRGVYYKHFLTENYDKIMELPEDVKKFIIVSSASF